MGLAAPASALAAKPFNEEDLAPTPALDKALIAHNHAKRGRERAAREARRDHAVAIPAHRAAIAACESGGNPRAIGGGGLYRGMFQFDQRTWNSVGGTGDPATASVAEQVKRAEILYAQSGPGQWPVCGGGV
jgi:hypothetical protein